MGLDVYLYPAEQFRVLRRYQTAEQQKWADLPEDYNDTDVAAMHTSLDALKTQIGYTPDHPKPIAIDSAAHPQHLYKIGYWRSAYNVTGVNHVLRTTIVNDLWSICPTIDGENAQFSGPWPPTLARAAGLLASFRAYAEATGPHAVWTIGVGRSMRHWPTSERDAMAMFQAVARTHRQQDGNYRTGGARYWQTEPLTAVAALPGTVDWLGDPEPCVYLITKQDDPYDWYIKAVEIVVETLEWIIAQEGEYVLDWKF